MLLAGRNDPPAGLLSHSLPGQPNLFITFLWPKLLNPFIDLGSEENFRQLENKSTVRHTVLLFLLAYSSPEDSGSVEGCDYFTTSGQKFSLTRIVKQKDPTWSWYRWWLVDVAVNADDKHYRDGSRVPIERCAGNHPREDCISFLIVFS